MKIFVQGMEDKNGGMISVMGSQPARFVAQDIQNTSVPLFPFVDLLFFTGIIMSLMAIAFGYNAVSGEKENGTLRLLLSYSVPRDKVLLGKWLGGYLTLIIPFVLAILGMMAILLVQRNIDLSSGQWLRFMLLLLLSLIYLAALYSLSLWVSTLTRKAATSIIVLVSIWVVLILAIPNLSPYVSNLFASSSTSSLDVSKARLDIHKAVWEDKLQKKKDAWDLAHGITPNWEKNADWVNPAVQKLASERWIVLDSLEKEGYQELLRENDKLNDKVTGEIDSRIALSKWISRLSPFACLSYAAVELAGVGVQEQRRYMKQVRDFQEVFMNYAYDETLMRNHYSADWKGVGKKVRWSAQRKPFPKFNYQPAALGAYVRPVLLDAALLVVFTIVFFMLSFSAFLRYDVR
jgi:ABC-type transport system involved in multi-copper enzyme maturation permease subunit